MSGKIMEWAILQDCTGTRKLVLLALAHYSSVIQPEPFAGFDTIADLIGTCEKTVQRAVDDLERLGLISVSRSTGCSNRYTLILEQVDGDEPDETPDSESIYDHETPDSESQDPGLSVPTTDSLSNNPGLSVPQPRSQSPTNKVLNKVLNKEEHIAISAAKSPNPKTVVDLYHEHLPMCPDVRKLTKTRADLIKARVKDDLPTVKAWVDFFKYVAGCDFLTGQAESHNGRKPFVANLEWLSRESNFVKVIEGNYEDKRNARTDG